MSCRSSNVCHLVVCSLALAWAGPPLSAGGGASRPEPSKASLGSQAKGMLCLYLLAGSGALATPAASRDAVQPAGAVPLKVPEGLLGTHPAARPDREPARLAAEVRQLAGRASKAYWEIMYAKIPDLPASLEEAVQAAPVAAPAEAADGAGPEEDPQSFMVAALTRAGELALSGLAALEVHAGRADDLATSLAHLEPVARDLARDLRRAQSLYEHEGRQALEARRSGQREQEHAAIDRWTVFGGTAFTLRQTLRWHREHPARILEHIRDRPAAAAASRPPRREEERESTASAGRNRTIATRPAAAPGRGRRAR